MKASEYIEKRRRINQLQDELEKIENMKRNLSKTRPSLWSFEQTKFMENVDESIKNIEKELELLNQ